MAIPLTRSPKDPPEAIPGMASFPGTGPADKVCVDCCHYNNGRRLERYKHRAMGGVKMHRCAKYSALAGGKLGAALLAHTPSCKYFEPLKKPRPV